MAYHLSSPLFFRKEVQTSTVTSVLVTTLSDGAKDFCYVLVYACMHVHFSPSVCISLFLLSGPVLSLFVIGLVIPCHHSFPVLQSAADAPLINTGCDVRNGEVQRFERD